MKRIENVGNHLWNAILLSSTAPIQLTLALSAILWSIFLCFFSKTAGEDATYDMLFHIAMRPVWIMLFLTVGMLLLWQFISELSIPLSRIINSATASLWSIYIFIEFRAHGGFFPDAADEIAMLIAAIWMTLRTGINENAVSKH